MKIAILASGSGEKTLHIYDFFKEGNRVEILTVLTDDPTSEAALRFAAVGIPVEMISGMDDGALYDLADRLLRSDVELLVVDGYPDELPAPLAEAFGEAVSYPSGVNEAPLEIIETVKRVKDREAAVAEEAAEEAAEAVAETKAETQAQSPMPPELEGTDPVPPTLEDEWARALDVTPPSIHAAPSTGQQSPLSGPQSPIPGQPSPIPGQPNSEPMPDTYLVWSVLATILCCLIPGIVAIVYSSSVSSKYYRGDLEGAKRSSRNAQIWVIVSVVTGIIWTTLYLPLSLLAG